MIEPSVVCDASNEVVPFNSTYAGRKVSKLFINDDDSDYIDEKTINITIHKIDPTGKYFVIPDVDATYMHQKCKIDKDTKVPVSNRVPQIVMPYAGVTVMKHATAHPIHLVKWIGLMKNVVDGIALLSKNQLVHFDIKPENIMYDGTSLRLIDFGMSNRFEKLYHRDDSFWPYILYPPEIYAHKVSDYDIIRTKSPLLGKIISDKINPIRDVDNYAMIRAKSNMMTHYHRHDKIDVISKKLDTLFRSLKSSGIKKH